MIVFPLVAALLSALLSFALFRQFSRRRRFPQFAWAVALAQYSIASLAVAGGVGWGWDPTLYRLFWLFGGLLNVPWLALGSIALLGGLAAVVGTGAVLVGTVWALFKTFSADVSRLALAGDQIPRGRDAWLDDSMVSLARWYSILAWIVVVAIAVLSSRPRRGVRPPVARVRGAWLVAVGVSIVAVGGFALSRVGRGAPFSVTLALGVLVMFAGFTMAGRAPRVAPAEELPPSWDSGPPSPPWGPPPVAPSG